MSHANQTARMQGIPEPSFGGSRVFFMTDSLETGGIARDFALMADAFRRSGFDIRLGCLRRQGPLLDRVGEIREFPLGGSFLTAQSFRARAALWKHLRRESVGVAHASEFYSNLMLIPVARLAGIPVVIGSKRNLGDLLNPMQRSLEAEAFQWSDRVVCNSQAAARRIQNLGLPTQKLVVISNGLPPAAFAVTPPVLPKEPGVQRLGLVARMNGHVKNHPLFLRAAARLQRKFPALEVVLAGDGPLRPELEQLAAQLGFGRRARFLGDRRDIAAVLASVDVSVQPSFSESLSNVILESMAAGKAVVACRVGGNSELIQDGETGLLVPPNDEEELSTALEFLLSRPALCAEWGARARQEALTSHGMEHVREQHEKLFREVLEEKNWKPRRIFQTARATGTDNRIRVAIVAPSLRGVGGQAVQADLLLRKWRCDPEIEATFIPIDPDFPGWLSWAEKIPYLRTMIRTPIFLASLLRELSRVDIAHIFSASYWSFLLAPSPALFIARWKGTGTIINYRSGEARDHLQNWRTAAPILRRADQLVVPSNYLVSVFSEFGLQASVVPNLVDMSQFSWRPRQPLRPRLVCTRGLEPYYSVDIVVRAFAEVKKAVPDARLCLVGGGSLETQIRNLVQELELADVEFAGPVSRSQIGRYYDAADIFINASWLDNMPGSVLEAFASGAVVVSTAPEGIRYIVKHEHTGLLSEPGDAHALAANVLCVLREPELAARIARNAGEESKRYHWDSVRAKWLELYRSVLGLPPISANSEPATVPDSQASERNLLQCRP